MACNLILILGLIVQYSWQNIESLLLDDKFNSVTSIVCRAVSCPEIERFDLSLFVTDELVVNSHPNIADALQIDFIFRNTANYEQLFPLVELNFSDLNRPLFANRLFTPEEYLEAELRQFTVMPANSSLQVRLEIADPGLEAVNYTLALRAP